MRISKIVENPGRFILHKNGVFEGEAWLLAFNTVVSWEPSDNVISCAVGLEKMQGQNTTVWLVYSQVADLIVPGESALHNFVVSAQPKMTDSNEKPLMTVHAIMLGGKLVTCYHNSGDALNAANPTNASSSAKSKTF